MSTYPEVEGDVIVPWGPGYDHGIGGADGLDALVIGHEIDMRPEGGTVASLEINIANGSDAEVLNMVGVELTAGDLMKLGNWAFDRATSINGTEAGDREIQYLQVTPVADDGESVEWVETAGDMDRTTAWAVYARVFDPNDGFVKAEFIREFAPRDPFYQAHEEAKGHAVELAFLISAVRWPVEVIDPRD